MDILDASALLAFIKKEKGGEEVKKLFEQNQKKTSSVFIHSLNYIEFLYKCEQIFGQKTLKQIILELQTPWLGIMSYMDSDLNFYAAHLKANYHLSLADATGLAHTKIMNGTFWTADNALAEIAGKEKIGLKLIR